MLELAQIEDSLLRKLKNELNIQEQEFFINSFFAYLNYHQEKDFVIDLDNVWEWCGFTRKDNCKTLLKKHFTQDVDYKSALLQSQERKNEGGFNKETIMMNIKTFKKLCLKAGTKRADEIHDYYIKMEEIMLEHTKEQLKNKELEYKQLLEAKEIELAKYKERTYEEIDKTGHVYVIGTDHGTYKIGKTKDVVTKRVRSLQTGNANDIKVYLDFKTSNPDILERSVHYILDRYRCNSNREFFDCDVNYITMVVTTMGSVLDTLKSSYQTIQQEELVNKLNEKLGTKIKKLECNVTEVVDYKVSNNQVSYHQPQNHLEERDFYKWLNDNIEVRRDATLTLKEVCERYLKRTNVPSGISCRYKCDIENYIKLRFVNTIHKYRETTYYGKRVRGWIGVCLKNNF